MSDIEAFRCWCQHARRVFSMQQHKLGIKLKLVGIVADDWIPASRSNK